MNEKTGVDVDGVFAAVEFDGRGYCPECFGWGVSENGCTPKQHRKDCRLVAALAHFAELLEAARALRPFAQDEADKYEDDGQNEPLEALRRFDEAARLCTAPAIPKERTT